MPDRFGHLLPDDSGPGDSPARHEQIPEDIVDAFFDGELERDRSAELFESLRNDPEAAKDIAWTMRAIDALRRPVASPDLRGRILARAGLARGGWVHRRERRWVTGGRIAAAVLVVGAVALGFTAQRLAPPGLVTGQEPAPLVELARSVPTETAGVFAAVNGAVTDLRPGPVFVVSHAAYSRDSSGPREALPAEFRFASCGEGLPADCCVEARPKARCASRWAADRSRQGAIISASFGHASGEDASASFYLLVDR